jgi:hypothetical protein
MRAYKYLRIYNAGSSVSFITFDDETKNWIFTEAKKLAPDCEIIPTKHLEEKYHFYITKLSKRDYEFRMQIIGKLLEQGWEPFQISIPPPMHLEEPSENETYHFRLLIEKD